MDESAATGSEVQADSNVQESDLVSEAPAIAMAAAEEGSSGAPVSEGAAPADPSSQAADSQVEEELEACQLQRQLSGASLDSSTEADGGGGGEGGGSGAALFADQEDAQPAPEQPPAQDADAAAASPKKLAAVLRSAQVSAASEGGGQEAIGAAESDLRRHAKHVFVFSTAGKPIYSFHGDESRLAGLMATAEAILSVAHSKGHTLKHVRAGQHVFVFLERPPLCLVGVSALAEPPAVLRMQLQLVHGQIVSLLTSTALSAMFARNPGYDARKLLGGSEGMLAALIRSFTTAPAALLGAYPSLPLLGGVRQALLTSLATAVKATSAVHGVVVCAGQVAAACPAQGTPPLQQWDMLLLLNLLGANQSFRHSGEAMTPICLPRYNPAANLHAYIHYVDAATHTAIVLLCGGMPDFSELAAARQHMVQQLEAIGALQAAIHCVQGLLREQEGGSSSSGGSDSFSSGSSGGSSLGALLAVRNLPVSAGGGGFGSTPLLHFAYKLSSRQQYVQSPFIRPLLAAGLQQSLMVAYSRLRAAMFEGSSGGGPLQRLRFEARPRFVVMGSVSGDCELFLAFDPLTDKAEAAGVCSRLSMWLHTRHDQLFNM